MASPSSGPISCRHSSSSGLNSRAFSSHSCATASRYGTGGRLLISVSGVGGNTARMILSTYSPRELQGIITSGNAVLLKNVKGLGLKTAQKIIVELSGKLTGLAEGDTQAIPSAGGEALDEALSALVMLGFAKAPAEKALRGIMRDNPAVSVEDLVRMALKIL